ncbi:unnamed protein product [Lymnaea stagnalis]|uniref:Uncharacterized protein n=1 Tax=Lymnaea stagnalis TaxID=6523 RepID=A0AAV2HX43_LYMST
MSYNNSEHVSNSLSSRELTPVITHVYNIQHAETVASDCQVITGHVLYHTRNIHWSCGRKDTMKPPTVAYTKEKGKMDGDNKRRTTPSTRQIKQMSGDNSRPTTPSTSQIKQMGGDNSTRTTPSTSQIKQMGGDNSTRTTPSTSQIKQMGGDNSTRTTPSTSQIKQMGGDNSTRTTPSTSQIKQMGGDNSTRTTPSTSQANLRHQKVPLQDLVKECEVVDSAHQRRDNITKGKERGKKRMRVVSSVADVHELNGNECTVHKKRRTYVKQLL